jgi:starch synthase
VSKNYSLEIQTGEGGFMLDDLVRSKAFFLDGIQNGIDDNWNPQKDMAIASTYSRKNISGKAACKKALQESLGLNVDPNVAVFAFIGRLTWQKGVDILTQCIDWFMSDAGNSVTGKCQVIMMGNGDTCYGDSMREAENRYKGRVCGYCGFSPDVERQIMAGADFLIMPSRYEPCGIPQMIALTYGTLPIVHATGGLKDSVVDISEENSNGYHIYPLTVDKTKEVLYKALETYLHKKDEFRAMQQRAMECDFYWPQAIDRYEQNFDYAFNDPPLYKL